MKYIVLSLMVILISFSAQVKAEEKKSIEDMTPQEQHVLLAKDFAGDLRGFVWGLPPTVILEYEPAYFLGEENGSLFYQDYYDDIKVTIGYEFYNNKLWRAKTFNEKYYLDPQDRIEDLLYIQELLTKRLGDPVKEEFFWRDKKEKGYPDNWGWAVFRGELFITIKWETKDSEVELYLGAETYLEPDMTITYVSRKLRDEAYKKSQDKLLRAPR